MFIESARVVWFYCKSVDFLLIAFHPFCKLHNFVSFIISDASTAKKMTMCRSCCQN